MPDAPRPLGPRRIGAGRALLDEALGGTPYLERAREILAHAVASPGGEYRALTVDEGGELGGLALFGPVAGTIGTARLYALALRRQRAGAVPEALLSEVEQIVRAEGARQLVAELPDDPAIADVLDALRAHGFVEEGRVPDFYRDGVALVVLRRPLGTVD